MISGFRIELPDGDIGPNGKPSNGVGRSKIGGGGSVHCSCRKKEKEKRGSGRPRPLPRLHSRRLPDDPTLGVKLRSVYLFLRVLSDGGTTGPPAGGAKSPDRWDRSSGLPCSRIAPQARGFCARKTTKRNASRGAGEPSEAKTATRGRCSTN